MKNKDIFDEYTPDEFKLTKVTKQTVRFSKDNSFLVIFFYFNEKKELMSIEFHERISEWGTHIDIYKGNREDKRWIKREQFWNKFKNHEKFKTLIQKAYDK